MNIYHLISNKVWGGGEQYVYDLSKKLIADDNYVEIVCRNNPAIITPFRGLEIPISTLPLKGLTDVNSARRLARIIRKGENIVHVHNFKDAFTACVARNLSQNSDVKVILTRHLVKRGKNSVVYHKLYKSLDCIIFVSNIAKDIFLSGHPKIDTKKIVVLHNSILPCKSVADVADIREKYSIPQTKALIMYHGRLVKEKGVDILLRALSQLDRNKFHLIIAGTGNEHYSDVLHDIIVSNRLQDNVTFLGHVEAVQPIIGQCDFGVLPSVGRESLGLSNMEYMMMGKAQICSNNGAQPEYLDNGVTAMLIEPEKPFLLASAIDELLNAPDTCKLMGQKAKLKFDAELSYSHFYCEMTDIYRKL
ncbi:MAG: glycosyltransferase family 4 protein [Muribaculaceae bacterium]